MYNLQKIDPSNWQDISILAQFYNDLAANPYCSNDKGFSHIRTKSHAIKHAYIQPNHPAICRWLVFDIDDPNALFAYYDNDLPPPQFIVKSKLNGHAHVGFRVTTEVGIGGNSSVKAMQYLASVQQALRIALGADRSYGGNLVKNPCYNSPSHEVYITGAQASYSLAELADYLDLQPVEQEPANDCGYGRNVSVFDYVRYEAYPLAQTHSYNELERVLTTIAEQYNQRFDAPLFQNELKHIVRSIARYCTRKDFTASHRAFSELQRARVTRRWGDNTDKRKQALKMHKKGVKKTVIAKELNVTTKTLTRWGLQKKKR